MDKDQQLKAIEYSIRYLEDEIQDLSHGARVNIHKEIRESLKDDVYELERDLYIFKKLKEEF